MATLFRSLLSARLAAACASASLALALLGPQHPALAAGYPCEAVAKAQTVASDPKRTYGEVLHELCGRLDTELSSNPSYAKAFEPLFKESIAWLENKPNRLVAIFSQVVELGTETYDFDDLGRINRQRMQMASHTDQLTQKTGLLRFMVEKILTLGDGPNEIGLFERVMLVPEDSLGLLKGQFEMADMNPAAHQTIAPASASPASKNVLTAQAGAAQAATAEQNLSQSPAPADAPPDLISSPSPTVEPETSILSGSVGTYLNLGISGLLLVLLIYALVSLARLKAQLEDYQEQMSKSVLPQLRRDTLNSLKHDTIKPLEGIITQLRQRVKEQGDALELLQPRPPVDGSFVSALELNEDIPQVQPDVQPEVQPGPAPDPVAEAEQITRAYLENALTALESYQPESLKPSKANQMERRNDAETPLELESAGTVSQAFYFAFALSQAQFAVLPSLQHTYNASLLSHQGLDMLYEIETVPASGTDKDKIIAISRPALMQKQAESWQLLHKGSLSLSA